MNANDVIRIGRSRTRAACSAARSIDSPCSRSVLANSTTRIAFLLASPTSMTSPTWQNTSFGEPAHRLRGERAEHRERHDQHDRSSGSTQLS